MQIDIIYKQIIKDILHKGTWRETRSGKCLSLFDYNFSIDLQKEFPLLTLKKVALKPMIGELLFFLTAYEQREVNLRYLRIKTFGSNDNQWTIWTDDQARWYKKLPNDARAIFRFDDETLGQLPYCFGFSCLPNLIKEIKTNPNSRRLCITFNRQNSFVEDDLLSPLPPCHYSIQFYVSNGMLNLKYIMRSNDVFLGFPFNVASYALLLHIVANICNLRVGVLSASLGDVHLYENQIDGAKECLLREPLHNNVVFNTKELKLTSIQDLNNKTSLDFLKFFDGYTSHPTIKCKVCVGK